jgi:hypothetical protein
MKKNQILTATVVAATMVGALHADDRKPSPAAATASFPATFLKTSADLQRFADPAYFKIAAADGLRSADPKVLYQRIAAASKAGERYKALYLSRIFTDLQPDIAAGWANRAQLAASLGFTAESAAARANAEAGSSRPVAGGALPGAFKARPATLADWAAALALTGDDVTAREGRPMVVSVKDNLSGVSVPSNEEILRLGRGPWVKAKPVQLEDVLTNFFVMPQATPMDHKSMKGGLFALGALAMAASAYSSSIGAYDAATQYSELYGHAIGNALEVPSEFKGGAYTATTYADGAVRAAKVVPKSSGKREAIETPVAMLWASGPSLNATFQGGWRNGDTGKSEAMKIDAKTKKQQWKKHAIPALAYPRLQRFCGQGQCSPDFTLQEVMLSREDLQALAPGTESTLPVLASWASRYQSRQPLSVIAAGDFFTGFDAAGVVYVTRQSPTEWLTSASAPAVKVKK